MSGNLLIVDDELDILNGLAELYELELEDVSIFTANNAKKALKLLEKTRFDVVITDINMPKMNGIQLFNKIHEGWPLCKVIFLTGYRDFEHLYEISKFKDVGYLLKSESDEVLVQAVKDAFSNLNHILSQEVITDSTNEASETSFEQQENQLYALMTNDYIRCPERRVQFLTENKFNSTLPLFFFFIQLDEVSQCHFNDIQADMSEIIKEFFPSTLHFYYQSFSDTTGGMIVQSLDDSILDKQQQYYINSIGALSYVQEKLSNVYGMSVSFVAFGEVKVETLTQIYQKALVHSYCHLRHRFQSIIKDESISLEKVELSEDKTILYQLTKVLERKDKELLERKTEKVLLEIIETDSEEEIGALYQSVMSMLSIAIVKEYKYTRNETFFTPYTKKTQALESLIETSNQLVSLYSNDPVQFNKTDETINRVINYINNHLDSNLSLDFLAEICYLNPSYLSRVFKKTTGEKVSEYVSEKRIDLAKELLVTSNMKMIDVGTKIGYHTPHSFTRLFKKHTGYSPTEYRDRFGKHE